MKKLTHIDAEGEAAMVDVSAKPIMLREAVQHLNGPTTLEKVYFVLFDPAALSVFQAAWKELLRERAKRAEAP